MADFPVLYSFRRCPYAIRARLALAASGSTVELREISLRDKPNALLSASPKATVPVLVLADGTVLEESLDIMHWALGRCDPQAWLHHSPAESQAQIALCDGTFKQALDRCKYPERFPEANAQVAWRAALVCLQTWEHHLCHGQLCGPTPSLADAAIFPFVRQFSSIDRERWATLPLPRLQAWLSAWLTSDLFAEVMEKYPPWRDGDAPVRVFGASAQAIQVGA